eukprot:06095.XXX_241073_241306_1 [CDS] Oithona nana genome sequencing.
MYRNIIAKIVLMRSLQLLITRKSTRKLLFDPKIVRTRWNGERQSIIELTLKNARKSSLSNCSYFWCIVQNFHWDKLS